MRIIREGRVPHKEIVHTCTACDTVFAFLKTDIPIYVQLWCDRTKIYYVECPLCGHEVISDEESYRKLS